MKHQAQKSKTQDTVTKTQHPFKTLREDIYLTILMSVRYCNSLDDSEKEELPGRTAEVCLMLRVIMDTE